jgi:hypothetical protein
MRPDLNATAIASRSDKIFGRRPEAGVSGFARKKLSAALDKWQELRMILPRIFFGKLGTIESPLVEVAWMQTGTDR